MSRLSVTLASHRGAGARLASSESRRQSRRRFGDTLDPTLVARTYDSVQKSRALRCRYLVRPRYSRLGVSPENSAAVFSKRGPDQTLTARPATSFRWPFRAVPKRTLVPSWRARPAFLSPRTRRAASTRGLDSAAPISKPGPNCSPLATMAPTLGCCILLHVPNKLARLVSFN